VIAPPSISADVRRLCRKLGDVGDPLFIPVQPRGDSQINDCFVDVERQVAERGGSIQHGWLVWLHPGILIEAEFHAVWQMPNGNLIDVSAKTDREKRVLFVLDRTRRFTGERLLTIYHPIGRDPRIREFIDVSSRFQKAVARKYRGRFGEDIVLDSDIAPLLRRKMELQEALLSSREARRALGRSTFPMQESASL